MATPTWDQMIQPILELAAHQPITRLDAREHVLKVMPMSQEEREARLKSGALRVGNRSGWAMSHLTKAKLIEKVAKSTYAATEAGKEFLKQHEGKEITYHDLKQIDGYVEAWESASARKKENAKDRSPGMNDTGSDSPEETIEAAVEAVEEALRSELLEQLASVDPYRFEKVVLDLLFAMGYGGLREEAAQVTQKSNDEGIDGVINEDRLGLDVIYV